MKLIHFIIVVIYSKSISLSFVETFKSNFVTKGVKVAGTFIEDLFIVSIQDLNR